MQKVKAASLDKKAPIEEIKCKCNGKDRRTELELLTSRLAHLGFGPSFAEMTKLELFGVCIHIRRLADANV